jgi:hypothetical protein
MEAIPTDSGMTGTARSLFGKASGAAGKGGGLFAALLELVGHPSGNAKDTDKGDGNGASNAAGLQGLLALFNPMTANGQNAGGDGKTADPLSALAAANGLDLSQLGDRSKLALLAQALAQVQAHARTEDGALLAGNNGDGASPTGDKDAPASLDGLLPDKNGTTGNLDEILAELRAQAAAKFGADNGKSAPTKNGAEAALKTVSEASADSKTSPNQTPLIEDGTLGLDPKAAAPVTATAGNAPATATPAIAAGNFVSVQTDADSDAPTEADNVGSSAGDSASTAAADGADLVPDGPTPSGPIPDGKAPPSKTPDAAASPYQKVEVAPPSTGKPDRQEPKASAATRDADKKPDPKSDKPAVTSVASDRTDKTARDDGDATIQASDAPDSSSAGNAASNSAAIDPRSQNANRGPIQVPADKLTPFLTQGDQLPLHIQRAVTDGRDHITIQIVPHDLGRIEIKLDFDRSGTINTAIAVDRPHTLELLRRDAGGLERALQDAGFKTDSGSLSFNLQSNQQQQYQHQQSNPGPAAWQISSADEIERSYRPTYRIASTADAIRAAADGRVNIAV